MGKHMRLNIKAFFITVLIFITTFLLLYWAFWLNGIQAQYLKDILSIRIAIPLLFIFIFGIIRMAVKNNNL